MTTAAARIRPYDDAAAPRALWLLLAAVISLALAMTPYGRFILYPFTLFTTWVHECSHALMALLVGGDVKSISILPDTSGLTRSAIPQFLPLRGLVTSSGYLGASVMGCLLIVATRAGKWAHRIIWIIGALMALSLVFWIRNPFGAVVVLAWAVALLWLGRHGKGPVSQGVLSLLAVQVGLNALYDIRVLFVVAEGQHSDAEAMQRLFLIPAEVWAGGWMAMSVVMMAGTLWLTRER